VRATAVREAKVQVKALDIEALGDLIRAEGLKGEVTASVKGTHGLRRVILHGEATRVAVAGVVPGPVSGTVDATFRDGGLSLASGWGFGKAGRIRFETLVRLPQAPLPQALARVSPKNVQTLELHIDALALDAVLREIRALSDIEGILSADVSFNSRKDILSLRASLADAEVGRFDLGRVRADVEVDSNAATTNFHARFGPTYTPLVDAEGEIETTVARLWRAGDLSALTDAPIRGKLRVEPFSLDRLSRHWDLSPAVSGQVEANVTIAGTLATPTIRGSGSGTSLRYGDAPLPDLRLMTEPAPGGPVVSLSLDQKEPRGSLGVRVEGLAQPSGTRARVVASDFDIRFLNPLLLAARVPVASLSGAISGQVELATGEPRPTVLGRASLRNGTIGLPAPFLPVEELALAAVFATDSLKLDLEGRSREGTLSLAAEVELDGLSPRSCEATLTTDGLPLELQGARVEASTEIALTAKREENIWDAEVVFAESMFRLPSLPSGTGLHPTGQLADIEFAHKAAPADRPQAPGGLRLRVRTNKQPLRVRSDDVHLTAAMDLNLDGTGEEAVLDGHVKVTQGNVKVFERRYDIERAEIVFSRNAPAVPRLSVKVVRNFPEARISVVISGPADAPEIELRATPPIYSRAEILGLIVNGVPGSAGGGQSKEDAALSALAGIVSKQLTSMVKNPVGVDALAVGTKDGGRVSSVTVGKWLTDTLFLAYHRQFEADPNENQDEARLEWWFLPNWLVEMRAGDAGAGSGDLLWIFRY